MSEDQPNKLTKAQEVFISEYLQCFNATEAYSRAYPKAKRDSARANGCKLLANTDILAIIQARLVEVHMSADEAIKRLSDMARGDIGQFMDRLGNLDIQAARDAGITPLIKKIKQRTVTKIGKSETDDDTEIHDLEIELYDSQAALDKILKVHGKYSDAPTVNVNMSWKDFVLANNKPTESTE